MQFSFSQTYADASRAVKERFGPLLGVLGIFLVLQVALTGVMMATTGSSFLTAATAMPGDPQPSLGIGFWVIYAVTIVVGMAGLAALCVMASLLRRPSVGDAIGDGFRSALSVVGALLVVIVGVAVIVFVISLVIGGSVAATNSPGLAFVGMLIMFAVFAWLFTRLSLTLPIIAVDGERNPFAAMARSWALTAGNAAKVFFVWFVFVLALTAIMLLIVFGLAGSLVGGFAAGSAPGIGTMVVALVVYLVLIVAINLYSSALTAAVHAQLAGPNAQGYSETFA
ncbi:MAG: glycerophosphoryl diester phosphodiesterase membrane domain-containing protein [Novosphingobium sp.]